MSSEKIERAKTMVKESDEIAGAHKEALIDMLVDAGNAANGVPEPDRPKATAKSIESMALYLARDAEHRPDAFRKILREEMPEMLETAFAVHKKDCPLYKEWDGRERRKVNHPMEENDDTSISAKSKFFNIIAKGKLGTEQVIRIVKVIMYSLIGLAAIYKAGELLTALNNVNTMLMRIHQ